MVKAPSPNGFQAGFCQKYWGVVSNDIFYLVEAFFLGNYDLSQINKTFIALIPKLKQ